MFMLEFCWIAVHLYMIFLTVAGLGALDLIEEKSFGVYSKQAFLAYWGIANGPLAAAAFLLGNSLVFHDIPNLASCFIHLTPCSATWSMRWYADKMNERWPNTFTIPDPDIISESFWDVVSPGIYVYTTWWTLYVLFFLIKGRHLGLPYSDYDTLYHYTMRKDKVAASVCGFNSDKHENVFPFIKYMALHWLGASLMISFSYLLWFNYWLHTLFCSSLFMFCTYNGATRYYNMMTKYY